LTLLPVLALPASFSESLAILAVGLLASAAAVLTVRRALRGTRFPDPVKKAIIRMMYGPVSAAVVGASLIESAYASSASLPWSVGAQEIALIVELGVLAITIRTTGVVAGDLITHVTGSKGADRVLTYGIYALGLVGLSYLLLTYPGSPVVIGGIWQTVGFIAGLTVTYLVVYIVSTVTGRYGEALYRREPHLRTSVTFVRRLAIGVVALIGVAATTFTVFPSAGTAIASIFVAAGFASIVVGLAAQSSLANIFAGVVVSTSQPFRIGDAVLYKEEWCWVEDIKLSFTILKTWDNRRLVVPNQLFLNDAIVNYDLNDSSKLVIVYVQVPLESDLDLAIELMKDAARRHKDFLPSGGLPVVHVMEYNESGISLRLLSNAKDQPTAFQMSKDLLYEVRKLFMEKGIRLSYPRRDLFIRTASDPRPGREVGQGEGG
jgi:small-conductance mechanosensitive channel